MVEVFPYHDGTRDRLGDPFRIERILTAHLGGSIKEGLQRLQNPAPEIAIPAGERLLRGVCEAFGVQRWTEANPQGFGESQLMDLFDSFLKWRREVKKKSGTSPTSPASTDSKASSPSPIIGPHQPANCSMDSGSTSDAPGSKPPAK